MKDNYKEFCFEEYKRIFDERFSSLNIKDSEKRRTESQRIAIRESSIKAIKAFPEVEPSAIWKSIYVAHVHNISGIADPKVIVAIISADNSWKKSSGHAFEEMIKEPANLTLRKHGIEVILQRELNLLLHEKRLTNEVRDISWLKEQVASSIFDLYLTLNEGDNYLLFGCIQSKTSIRDRVTRDREPSINAMKAFFMSIAVVLDGDFLRLPKFKNMVNGNSSEYDINGWHGMYVFTNEPLENDRIHGIDISMEKFVQDVIKGAEFWKKQRQWFDHKWRPTSNT